MQYEVIGNENKKTLMLLPGTCCNWQTNFGTVIPELSEKYRLICVNYDGFDGQQHPVNDIHIFLSFRDKHSILQTPTILSKALLYSLIRSYLPSSDAQDMVMLRRV